MPRAIRKIDVSVTDRGKEQDKRLVSIVIQAQPDLFQLSDLLAQEGAVHSLEKVVERASKCAVVEYIESGKKLVKGVNKRGVRKTVQK